MNETPTNRDELHDLLVDVLGSDNVYFDPPEKIKIKYPAIVYHKNHITNRYASNKVYSNSYTYTLTLIDEYPDSEVIDKLSNLPYCKHNQSYSSNGMFHEVFTIKF